MRTKAKKRLARWRPGRNPWTWAAGYLIVICFAHCSEFDPNDTGLSGFGELTSHLEAPFARREKRAADLAPLISASRTIEKLKRLPEPPPALTAAPTGAPTGALTPEALPPAAVSATVIPAPTGETGSTPDSTAASWSVRKMLYMLVDGVGLRQNWRLFQLPHPEVLGYEVKSYYREVREKSALYTSSFSRCLELDDRGQCAPAIGSRLEFEMLREMERRRSPEIFDAFSRHWAGKSAQPVDQVFRRYEFVVYRHAFKLAKDFTKRGHAQILYAKDF